MYPRAYALAGSLGCCLAGLAAGCTTKGLDWQGSPAAVQARERAEFATYQASFLGAMGATFDRRIGRGLFLDKVESRRVLFLGDNHRDFELHRRHVELLTELHGRGQPLCLLVECVGTGDQQALDDYLAHHRSLTSLRRNIRRRWPGSWLDDVDLDYRYYNALLELARTHRWPVVALEPTPRLPLAQRDPTMAQTIAAAAARHPDRLLVVVVGQTHLLGNGDLAGRVRLPATLMGASVTPDLRRSAGHHRPAGTLLRSEGGLWFFADHLPIGSDRDSW